MDGNCLVHSHALSSCLDVLHIQMVQALRRLSEAGEKTACIIRIGYDASLGRRALRNAIERPNFELMSTRSQGGL